MRTIDIIRLAMRIFKHNKLRTFLTILGVGIGIAAILFLVSLGYGIQQLTVDRIASLDSLSTLDVAVGDSGILKINGEILEKFKQISGVTEVSPVINISSQSIHGESIGDTVVNGIHPDYFRLEGITLLHGKIFEKDEENSIVISTAVLDLFGINPNDALDKELRFNYFITKKLENGVEQAELEEDERTYKIIGVVEDDNSSYAYLPFGNLGYLSLDEYHSVKVKVDNVANIGNVKNSIAGMGYNATAVADTLDQMNQVFNIVRMILGALGIIALVVASIGMFNTMTISLLERTREIGVMKALGAGNFDVWKLFLSEAMMVGFLGGMSGTFLGWLAGRICNFAINMLAKSFGGQPVELFVTPSWFIIAILAFSFFVGFFTGVYPARRAAKINPLEALRYE